MGLAGQFGRSLLTGDFVYIKVLHRKWRPSLMRLEETLSSASDHPCSYPSGKTNNPVGFMLPI
jgi:hypothetical protein